MTITVELSAQLRDKAGAPGGAVEVDEPCRLRDLIAILCERWGGEFGEFLRGGSDRPRPAILISINDGQASWEENPELRDGDTVSLLSPIAGG